MGFEKILREFLKVIDFELCDIGTDAITIHDMMNKDSLNQLLKLPIDFTSSDSLRSFKSGKIDSSCSLNVANTKYPEFPFVKNGIDSFNLSFIKDESKADSFFLTELFHDGSLYMTTVGMAGNEKYVCYKKGSLKENINISYTIDDDCRKLSISEITIPRVEKEIYIFHDVIDNKCYIALKSDGKEVYRQEISSDKIEDYFRFLFYQCKDIIQQANNGIKKLNSNIFELMFDSYDVSKEFMGIVNGSQERNETIDSLFQIYFSNKGNTGIGQNGFVRTLK